MYGHCLPPALRLKQLVQSFFDRADADGAQPDQAFESGGVRRGHDDLFEAERLRLARARLRLHRAAHLARQTDFAEDGYLRVDDPVPITRHDGGDTRSE